MSSGDSMPKCPDCQQTFPFLSASHRQCEKCLEAEKHLYRSFQWEQVMKWPQCSMCGASWKNMPLPNSDGHQTCNKDRCTTALSDGHRLPNTQMGASQAAEGRSLPADLLLPQTIAARSGTLYDFLKSTQRPNPSAHSHTTTSLQARENIIRTNANISAGRVTDKITVEIKYRVSSGGKRTRIDDTYGSIKRPFDCADSLWTVQDYALKQFNIVHTKNGAKPPVDISETLLRQQDNRTIESAMMGSTLHQWFTHLIEQGLLILPGLPAPSTIRPGKSRSLAASGKPIVPFELFIMMNMYEDRLEEGVENLFPTSQIASRSQGKRRNRSESMLRAAVAPGPSKLARIANTGHGNEFRSYFSLPPSALPYRRSSSITSTKLEFQKLICSALSPQGDGIFENDSKLIGYLADAHFAKGTMKAVFEIVFPALQSQSRYVAKRFYRLEEGDSDESDKWEVRLQKNNFTTSQHNDYMQSELVRLARGNLFLKEFFKLCKEQGVNVYSALRFTDAFLVQELNGISPASGMEESPSDDADSGDNNTGTSSPMGLMWLVEKRHASERVQKFCGTLRHTSSSSDLAHLTVSAFNHFVYQFTHKKLIYADLQGTPGLVTVDDEEAEGTILFDPMTHTETGYSGIGDFGQLGIDKFLCQHKCKEICQLLQLNQSAPLVVAMEGRERDRISEDKEHEDDRDKSGAGNN